MNIPIKYPNLYRFHHHSNKNSTRAHDHTPSISNVENDFNSVEEEKN